MDGWLSVFDGVKCCIREGRNGGREGAGDMRVGLNGMFVGLAGFSLARLKEKAHDVKRHSVGIRPIGG